MSIKNQKHHVLKRMLILAASLYVSFLCLSATSETWDDGHATSNWSQGNNWTNNTQPGSCVGDTANFMGCNNSTVTVNTCVTLGTINFDDDGNWGLAGGGGGITMDSTAADNAQINVSNINGCGAHWISEWITLNDDLTVNQGSAGDLALWGAIGGAHCVTKMGTGNLIMGSGCSSYTGTTSVLEGNIFVRANVGVSTNDPLGNAASAVLVGNTSGAVDAGLLIEATSVSIARDVTVQAGNTGTVSLGTRSTICGACWSLQNHFSGAIILNKDVNLVSGNDLSTFFDGVISGTGAIIVPSTCGSIIITGDNTFSGNVTVESGGLLDIQHNDGLGDTGCATTTTVVSGGSLIIGPGLTIDNENFVISGTGTACASTGAITMGNCDGASTLTGTVTLAADSEVHLRDAGDILTLSGVISDGGSAYAVVKEGCGTLILSGTNTYTGDTTITKGVLQLGACNVISNSSAVTVACAATFDVNDKTDTVGSIAGQGNITLGSGALSTGSDDSSTVFCGVISETGSLTKVGTGNLTLAGSNTYTGDTTIAAGTLTIGTNDVIADTSDLILSGGTLDTNDNNETMGNLTLAASSTITMSGTGSIMNFSNVVSHTGTLTINNWNGTIGQGGGADRLIFTSNSNVSLTSVNFYNAGGYIGHGQWIDLGGGSWELVASGAPETSTYVVVGLMAALLLYRERRRLLKCVLRKKV